MTPVQELEKQLVEAKKADFKNRQTALVDYYNKTLAGRDFLFRGTSYGGQEWWSLMRFGTDVKLKGARDGEEPELRYPLKYVTVMLLTKSRRSRDCYRPEVGIKRIQEESTLKSAYYDLSSATLIPPQVFDGIWELPKVYASTVQAILEADYGPVTDLYEKPKRPIGELDFPHAELTPYEATILQNARFFVGEHIYLITPNSLNEAREILREAEATEDAGRGYYQACDQAYLANQRDARISIRKKLGIATVSDIANSFQPG